MFFIILVYIKLYIYIYVLYAYMYRYSPVWMQLWAYNTHEIIGRGRNPRQIISRVLYTHNCLQTGLYIYVFYAMVTQKYAIKSHLTSRNHSTIPISVYYKNCENTIRWFSGKISLSTGMLWAYISRSTSKVTMAIANASWYK